MSTAAQPAYFPEPTDGAVNAARAIPRWRRLLHLGTSLLVAAGFWFAAFGLPALLLWWQAADSAQHATGHVNEAAVGALLGVLLGGGALAQAWRPLERVAVTQHTLLASIAAAVTCLIAGRGTDVAGNAQIMLLLAAILLASHPGKRELLRVAGRVSPTLVGLAIPGAVALLSYAWIQGARQVQLPANVPATADGRAWLAEIAAASAAIAVVATVAAMRRPGWRISAWSAGIATSVLGASWLTYPTDDGSLGVAAGAVAVVAAAAFVAVAERAAGRPAKATG